MSIIEINHVTKDYGNQKGIFDVSFSVKKGEVFGFLGPNGAGKTTTIRHLMGFIKPQSGTLHINGLDCFKEADKVQASLGYLPGEIAFPDDMTGMQFVKFIANMKGIKDLSRVEELIKFFELDPSGKLKKMSKGMKQKIGIVCAFMQDTEILILDEPTSGLDPLMQSKFVDLLLKEKEKGTTILISSHIFEEVERTCDRVAIIKEGKIVSIENIDDLNRGRSKIYEITFKNEEQAQSFKAQYKEASVMGELVTLHVREGVDQLIKALGHYTICDINIKVQSLEEFFMHFYGGGHND